MSRPSWTSSAADSAPLVCGFDGEGRENERGRPADRESGEENVAHDPAGVLGDEGEPGLEADERAQGVDEVGLLRPAERMLVHQADRGPVARLLGPDLHRSSTRASSRRTWVRAFPSR